MKRPAIAMLFLLSAAATGWGDESQASGIDLVCYGVSAQQALTDLAEKAKLELDLGETTPAMDMPVWLGLSGTTPQRAARHLSTASGLMVQVSEKRLVVREPKDAASLLVTRGYDASVLGGRFVEYVKSFGHPDHAKTKGVSPDDLPNGVELASRLVVDVLDKVWGTKVACSVAGDRIVITAHEWEHRRINELLALLIADGGGPSDDLAAGAQHLARLEDHRGLVAANDRPLGSVVAGMCREAKADFVVHRELAGFFSSEHTVLIGEAGYGELLRALIRQGPYDFKLAQRDGALALVHKDVTQHGGYRVFETGELLKRMDQAYQRQHSRPGGPASLRDAGGVTVVAGALKTALSARDIQCDVCTLATRLVVCGNAAACQAAAEVLKELGWVPPESDG